MKDRSSASLIAAYTATFKYYRRSNQTPWFQRLDNETSTAYLRDVAKVIIEFVPPNSKRTNTIECIIRSWRNHCISGLHLLDALEPNHFPKLIPLQCWDYLLNQTDLTYNILHPCPTNPSISAYERFHGAPCDFAAHSIAPLNTHVVVYESPPQRNTWAAHGVDLMVSILVLH